MQPDDGNRDALAEFLLDKEENFNSFYAILASQGQYWKARVLLELIWEYEKRNRLKIVSNE